MTSRIYVFDVLKFLFSIVISVFHLSWKYAPQGYLCVELFFVISGFLIFFKMDYYKKFSINELWLKRIKSYYGYYLIFLIGYFLYFARDLSIADVINSLLFMQFMGLGQSVISNTLWFLGVYTYLYFLYLVLIKYVDFRLFPVLAIFLYILLANMYYISPNRSIMWTYENAYRLLGIPFCVWRGVADIGIGLCIACFMHYRFKIPFVSIIIASLIILLFYIFTAGIGSKYDYLVPFIGGILLLFAEKNQDCIAIKVLNYIGKKFHYICSLSLPIYIFHCMVIDILKKLNYSAQDYPPLLYLFWVVLLSVVMERLQRGLILIYRQIKIRL